MSSFENSWRCKGSFGSCNDVTDSATWENQPLMVCSMGSNMTTQRDRCSVTTQFTWNQLELRLQMNTWVSSWSKKLSTITGEAPRCQQNHSIRIWSSLTWWSWSAIPLMKGRRLSTWKAWSMDTYQLRYALVRVANKFGKGFADRILCLRPDWIPTKLCKPIRIKKPRDFRDEDSFIWLLTNSQHVRYH